jgi:conjugative relaxase-like TrwC/TraI family protein
VIATVRVLGLAAPGRGGLPGAARRFTAYLQGFSDPAGGDRAGYYDQSATPSASVEGIARGSIASLVGFSQLIEAGQLEAVLSGRHGVSGRSLLPAAGSNGRADPGGAGLSRLPETVTVEQAAAAVGVEAGYLRRLLRGEQMPVSTAADLERPASRPADDRLRGWKEPGSDRWMLSRAEVVRFAQARQPPAVVVGYDLVCSAPKSVSLLWAFGDAELRADIDAAMSAGIDAVMGYLERHAAVGTVDGLNRRGLGLAVASYRHDVSRSDEAHLHVHNVIANAIAVPMLDADGHPVLDERGVGRIVWRALDGEVLLRHVKTAGYVGAAAMRHELSARRGLRWGPVRNGVADLAGFPRGLLDAFSSRRGQLLEEFAQLVDAGFAADAATLATAQRTTRATKRVMADDEVHAIQLARLEDTGWTPGGIRALGARQDPQIEAPSEAELGDLYDHLTGPLGLTEHRSTFDTRGVVQAVASWANARLTAEQVLAVAERFTTDRRVVLLDKTVRRRRSIPEPIYTTSDLLAAEQRLLARYRAGRHGPTTQPAAPVAACLVEEAIADVSAQLDGGLSDEQAQLVRAVVSKRDSTRLVVGPAGSGKTEAMRAVVRAFDRAGYRVLGAANGGRQAEELHQRLSIPTKVVAGWLTSLDHAQAVSTVWPKRSVLIVDEATQVGTRDADRLLAYAEQARVVVIFVGDPAQLGSVAAGGWFAHLTQTTPGVPCLQGSQRQRGPGMAAVRHALTDLRTNTGAQRALDRLAADNRIRVCKDRAELLSTIVADWYADRRRDRPTRQPGHPSIDVPRMLAERQQDVTLLNDSARVLLRVDGTLQGPSLRVAGRDFQVGDEVITLTQAGHTLVPHGQPPTNYIRTGSIGTVTAVSLAPRAFRVTFPGKGEVDIDDAYLTYSFRDGREGGLTHAYALTAQKAEGATLSVARAVAVDDTSRAGLYVMLSRGRTDLRAYVVARRGLTKEPTDEPDGLPILSPENQPVAQLTRHLQESRSERLASEQLWVAAGSSRAGAALDPPRWLVDDIGPRPSHGPDRQTWDDTVTALAHHRSRPSPAAPRGHESHLPGTSRQHVEATKADRLLLASRINHLARRPTADLLAEIQAVSSADPVDSDRRRALAAALDRQVDHAVAQLAHSPAAYLTAFLGSRPPPPHRASTWDRHATAIEHYRHHVLGLSYGTPAAPATAIPAHQALGGLPADPQQTRRYADLTTLQATLDLGTEL